MAPITSRGEIKLHLLCFRSSCSTWRTLHMYSNGHIRWDKAVAGTSPLTGRLYVYASVYIGAFCDLLHDIW
jgi:hypothetical protein